MSELEAKLRTGSGVELNSRKKLIYIYRERASERERMERHRGGIGSVYAAFSLSFYTSRSARAHLLFPVAKIAR